MTGFRPPGPPSSDTPPAWFLEAQRAGTEQQRREREASQSAARTQLYTPPGRHSAGPVRQNATPWVGAPGSMFPAGEDATQLIQRITDQAVRDDVREARAPAAVADLTVADLTAGDFAAADPAGPDPTVAGMKTATTAGVVRAGALMAIATVVSRLSGLLAKIALLAIIGTELTNSAYTVANTLPNIVFELLIGGVLTSVAIPLLTRAQRSDPDGGQEYTQRLLTIAVVGLLVATIAAVACAPLLAKLYVSGSSASNSDLPAQLELTTQLGRLLLPQIFFYGIAALFGAILNTKERFAANAWAPVLNNIVVIGVAGVLFIEKAAGNSLSHGLPPKELLILGVGTTLGIVLQSVVMIPSLIRSGFRFRWRWGWDRRLTEAGGLVGWALVYVLISQVGVVVTTRIAFSTAASGPTIFSYASLLFQMPYGILGVAVLTAIMPRLSRHAAAGQMADVKNDVSLANRLSAVALLPVSAALVVLGGSLATVLFQYGEADADDVLQIGLTIGGMALGLVPLAMTLVQMRVFYAMKDSRTPTFINGIMVAVRVPLLLASLLLDPHYVLPGLALSTAVSYLVGAVVGEIWLRARFGPMGTRRTLVTVGKMIVASTFGGSAAFGAVYYTDGFRGAGLLHSLQALLIGGVVGLLVIALVATALRVEELNPARDRVLRLLGRRPALLPARSSRMPAASGMPGATARPASSGVPAVAEMAGSIRPGPETRAPIAPASQRKQVLERVTHAGAGGPRDTPPNPAGVPPGAARGAPPVGASDPTLRVGGRSPAPGSQDTANAGNRPGTAGGSGSDNTVNLGSSPTISDVPPVQLAPGATVGARYRLVSLVAADDAGNRFWRAKDTVLPRDMAVTLLPDTNATSATVARTLRVGRLHHIGLPQTLDVGTDLGQSYVVGQWVDGATLTDLVASGPLEPDVATSITAKVSEAVAEAHRNGIALGAINPSLVRVNFDGQVRLSHVIAHGSATPDQDIRAVGGLLYLMLTGAWPLGAGAGTLAGGSPMTGNDPTIRASDGTVRVATPGSSRLTQAPTRRGREVPASEVRPGVPPALSALAERALHPEDAAGIHAVGAIAALLRQPDVAPAPAARAPQDAVRPTLNPSERRLVGERRVKLGVAAVMIAAFSALIIIVVASLSKQVLASVAGPSVGGVEKLTVAATTTSKVPVIPPKITPKPAPTKSAASTTSSAVSTTAASTTSNSAAPAATPQKITGVTVYDPKGDGVKDNPVQAPQAFDGDPQSFWSTFQYKQQFPSEVKPGVGLCLEFDTPVTPTAITVSTQTPDTAFEIRAAAARDLPYEQTTAIGRGNVAVASQGAPGSVNIALANAPKSKYLVVFVVHMASDGSQFQSDISEITVNGTP